ncbi:MAG: hypothetical protein IJP17_01190 [Clostridia bacterium]|nr:hypothetical protein [Clostridia bacterium]
MINLSEPSTTLTFKERPLVRCGDEIYYGSFTDKFIIMMKILSSKKVGNTDVADKIEIQLQYTDPDIKGKGKIVKSSTKESMANALELADAWLGRNK